jgi:DamX protein
VEFTCQNRRESEEGVFFTPERQQRLDLILHLIPNTRQSILLRGPEQSGKSFFIRRFKAQADKKWRICSVSTEKLMKNDTPLQVCAEAFDGLEGNEKKLLVCLAAWSKAGEKVIICVEDAHHLDIARHEFLFQLSDNYECIQLLLTSSDNLGEEVESQCQPIDIEPFTQKQTSEYAKLRVNRKGLDFASLAGIDDVVLFIETGGLPGRINDVLDQMLMAPESGRIKPKKEKPARLLWILGAAGVLMLTALFSLFLDSDESSVHEKVKKDQEEAGINIFVPEKSPIHHKVQPVELKQDVIAETPIEQEKETETETEQKNPEKFSTKVVDDILAAQVEKAKAAGKQPKDHKKVVVDVERELIIEERLQAKPDVEKIIPKAIEVKTIPDESVLPSTSTKQKPIRDAVELTELQKNHIWLNKQDKNGYTLQLIGVSNEKSARDYISKHKGAGQLHFFQNKRNKGVWFSVIYGNFKDKVTALIAAKKLPASLGKLKPWVRSFAAVQGDIYGK